MKIRLGTKLELPLSEEQKEFAEFEVTNFTFYGDYAAFDGRANIEIKPPKLWEKIKWIFTNKPILIQQQVGVVLKNTDKEK